MKKTGIIVLMSAMLVACGGETTNNQSKEASSTDSASVQVQSETAPDSLVYFGDRIEEDGALDMAAFNELMLNTDTAKEVKVAGTLNSVCQKKGCWARVDLENGNEMLVRFKDYGFFLPMDADGKTAVLYGKAYTDTISVAQLQHYAEDAGKSKEEIESITEPEVKLAFLASGVKLK